MAHIVGIRKPGNKRTRQMNCRAFRYLLVVMLSMPALTHAQCDVVATVFDTAICQTELSSQDSRPGTNPIPPERQKVIEIRRLSIRIRAIAAEHLLSKDRYTPTEDEIDRYMAFQEKADASRVKQTKEIIATIEQLLKTYQYTEVNRKRLEDSLAIHRRSEEQSKRVEEDIRLRDEDMRKRFGKESVKELYTRLKKGRREISEQWVASWKMNKALYENYGGRVIFQQAGIEPIDAYRAQLKDIREKGDLKIVKPEYEDVFAEFERYLDMGHNFLDESDDKYFDRPYWETADLDESHRRAVDEYKAIPH